MLIQFWKLLILFLKGKWKESDFFWECRTTSRGHILTIESGIRPLTEEHRLIFVVIFHSIAGETSEGSDFASPFIK